MEDVTEATIADLCKKYEVKLEDVCPDAVCTYIKEKAAKYGYHPLFEYASLSALVSNFSGKSVIQVNPGWDEPFLIQNIVISQKGTNKSSACSEATKSVVEIENLMFQDKKKSLKRRLEDVFRSMAEDKDNNLEENQEKRSKVEKLEEKLDSMRPDIYKRYHSNITPEALTHNLCKSSGELVLIYDEFNSFLRSLGTGTKKGSSELLSFWVTLFNQNDVLRNTTIKHGTLEANDPRVNLLGFIQGEMLLQRMGNGEDGSGVFDRFTMLFTSSVVRDWEAMFAAKIASKLDLHNIVLGIFYSHRIRRVYTFTKEAQQVLFALNKEVNLELSKPGNCNSSTTGMLRKYEAKAIRQSGVIAALRIATKLSEETGKPKNEQWMTADLNALTEQKKIDLASKGRSFVIDASDVKMAVILQKQSVEIQKVFINTAKDIGEKTTKIKQVTSNEDSFCEPCDVKLDYFIANVSHISRIYDFFGSKDEVKVSMIQVAKYYPQVRKPKGASATEKLGHFLKALDAGKILKYDEERQVVSKMKKEDDLDEDSREVFFALKKAANEKGLEFNPLDIDDEDVNKADEHQGDEKLADKDEELAHKEDDVLTE